MDVEGKLQLKDVDADDFGAMRSQFVVMKRIVDELYATSEMAMSRSQLNHLFGEYYDVGTIVDAYEIFGGYVNRSFGAIVEKDGVRKDYFIRKYKRDATDADIKVEHNLIEYAIAHGMKDAAGVIRTKDGESFVKMVEEKEGQKVVRTFAVYEYLDGEDTYDWINTNMTPEEDAEFARILAKFHNFTNGFDPGEKEEARILDLVKMFKKKFPLMGNGMEIPAYNRFYRLWKEATPFFVEMCDKVTDGLTKDLTDGMPECPCHCDIHPGNVNGKMANASVFTILIGPNWIIACLTFVLPCLFLFFLGSANRRTALV